MPAASHRRRLICAVALATACSAMTASTASALNPQPLPPRVSGPSLVDQPAFGSNWQVSTLRRW